MDNQHRKIAGYRELSQEEIDLMNRIKAKGAELLALQRELNDRLTSKREELVSDVRRVRDGTYHDLGQGCELARFDCAEPLRWAAIGKTDIQTGIMALVRAVAQSSEG